MSAQDRHALTDEQLAWLERIGCPGGAMQLAAQEIRALRAELASDAVLQLERARVVVDTIERRTADIDELLSRAAHYDDEPHQLYLWIAEMAGRWQWGREEARANMLAAYEAERSGRGAGHGSPINYGNEMRRKVFESAFWSVHDRQHSAFQAFVDCTAACDDATLIASWRSFRAGWDAKARRS